MALITAIDTSKFARYGDQKPGTIFKYGVCYYIKVDTGYGCKAVSLGNGETVNLNDDTEIATNIRIEITND